MIKVYFLGFYSANVPPHSAAYLHYAEKMKILHKNILAIGKKALNLRHNYP